MRRLLYLLVAWPMAAGAHELWLDTQPGSVPTAGTVSVTVANGHYFPASAMALPDRLLRSLQVRRPDGTWEEVATHASGNRREGALPVHQEGLHVLTLVVQKPQLDRPDAWARHLLSVGAPLGGSYPADPLGLELVPLGDLAALRTGNTIELEARKDGTPCESKLQVVHETGGADWLTAKPGHPAELTLRKPGRYLVSFSQGAQSCSLTFHVVSP